jgi:hypothetical protein
MTGNRIHLSNGKFTALTICANMGDAAGIRKVVELVAMLVGVNHFFADIDFHRIRIDCPDARKGLRGAPSPRSR